MQKESRTIGIIGGMGPQAGVDLYNEIIRQTDANGDQEHLPVILLSDTTIPSRTDYILNNGESPLPKLIENAKRLEKLGACCVLLGCNAAYYFAYEIQKHINIPLLNMVYETSLAIKRDFTHVKKVGLLATTANVKVKLYHQYFADTEIEVITPSEEIQESNVTRTINNVKYGILDKYTKKLIFNAAGHLKDKGAELVIQGCTELPIIIGDDDFEIPIVNPTRILAAKAIEYANQLNGSKLLKEKHKPIFNY